MLLTQVDKSREPAIDKTRTGKQVAGGEQHVVGGGGVVVKKTGSQFHKVIL